MEGGDLAMQRRSLTEQDFFMDRLEVKNRTVVFQGSIEREDFHQVQAAEKAWTRSSTEISILKVNLFAAKVKFPRLSLGELELFLHQQPPQQ